MQYGHSQKIQHPPYPDLVAEIRLTPDAVSAFRKRFEDPSNEGFDSFLLRPMAMQIVLELLKLEGGKEAIAEHFRAPTRSMFDVAKTRALVKAFPHDLQVAILSKPRGLAKLCSLAHHPHETETKDIVGLLESCTVPERVQILRAEENALGLVRAGGFYDLRHFATEFTEQETQAIKAQFGKDAVRDSWHRFLAPSKFDTQVLELDPTDWDLKQLRCRIGDLISWFRGPEEDTVPAQEISAKIMINTQETGIRETLSDIAKRRTRLLPAETTPVTPGIIIQSL